MAQVLRDLPPVSDPKLLVGTSSFDDAGVYQIDEHTALVLTVDFFPPLVDDPFEYGRIAAANSLSDVYAMGGRPITALNIVGFPDDKLPLEMLSEILRGGAERVTAAGAIIAGGHTVRDEEVKYGLSVTGLIDPSKIITNAGAKVGDALVLTKPIGSGVLTSAAKAEKIPPADLQEAIDVMSELNAGACAAMLEVGVNAATDITGFGLIGHAYEMAQGSDVCVQLEAASVPLLQNAHRLAAQGILTRTHKATIEYVGSDLDVGNTDDTLVRVLADAQTSGGLLIAVPADRCDALIAALKNRKTSTSTVIGQVRQAGGTRIELV